MVAERRPAQPDYAELRRRVKDVGLLQRQPGYYGRRAALTFAMVALGLSAIALVHNPWFQAANAIFLAFGFTQLGFLGHEAGHKAILRGGRPNDAFCILVFNLILGGSAAWWVQKHNAHHSNPNHEDLDPDISLSVVAFSQEQALAKRGIQRLMVRYQAFLFFPLLTFVNYAMRGVSVRYLLTNRTPHRWTEMAMTFLHYPLFLGLILTQLGLVTGAIFIVVHEAAIGLYFGLAFAPNHKGMPVLAGDHQLDFVRRQVITSRNLKRNRVNDYLFGPLATQIEHHLFPNMARNNGRKAEPLVKAFCRERSIPYHETGVVQAFREIVQELHEVSAPLRRGERAS